MLAMTYLPQSQSIQVANLLKFRIPISMLNYYLP